jgi:hypothetical protein
MIVVLSGEGSSDLGQCENAQSLCRIPEFIPGPMTVIVDKIIKASFDYSLLEVAQDRYLYISEERLRDLAAQRKRAGNGVVLTGKKTGRETGYFQINAWMLGQEALRLQEAEGDQAIAVLFRDGDGTRSSPVAHWDKKVESMNEGFKRSGLGLCGVPMMPKPKSEAWLLCAARPNAYRDCAFLEARSGNDKSQNSLKDELSAILQGDASAYRQVEWLIDNGLDHIALADEMKSFADFSNRLQGALTSLRDVIPAIG